ncbi:MAG: chromate efflux transporter [Planctomycetota bacterium]|nr:chromate efflux transporter [Planctomycetota bacterium]MDA1106440.1 chromate efflux transporter [Planctomycetota bacterium]
MPMPEKAPAPLAEIAWRFLVLGCTAFGGPIAHLGMLRENFVARHRWLSEHAFADIVSLAQLLPGPTSSQTVFAIGLCRRGFWGGVTAACCFSLPGALVLCAAGLLLTSAPEFVRSPWARGLLAFATAVVAIAVFGMVRRLTHGNVKGLIASTSFLICAAWQTPLAGAACVVLGLVVGAALCPRRLVEAANAGIPVRRVAPWFTLLALAVVAAVLILPFLPFTHDLPDIARMVIALAQSGSLVFGGGHVVLPMMDASLVETKLVNSEVFLGGYALTQTLPGPLFNVGAFLGASKAGILGGVLCTVALFAPGLCLMGAALPMWSELSHNCRARRALDGANAAVTGVLLWALIFVLIPDAIGTSWSMGVVAVGAVALLWHRAPLPLVGAICAMAGFLIGEPVTALHGTTP